KYEIGELPPFLPMCAPTFKWATRDAVDFMADVNWAYETTTKWRKNVFKLASGQSGKHFTSALTRLYDAYGSRSAIECKQQPFLPLCFCNNLQASPPTAIMCLTLFNQISDIAFFPQFEASGQVIHIIAVGGLACRLLQKQRGKNGCCFESNTLNCRARAISIVEAG